MSQIHASGATVARIINCTGGAVFVWSKDRPLRMDERVAPVIMQTGDRGEVCEFVAAGAQAVGLAVSPGIATSVMFLPPVLAGTRYLVEPDVLVRCAHRTDLLTPAYFTIKKVPRRWAGRRWARTQQFVSCLTAVHSSLDILTDRIRVVELTDC